MRIGLKWCTPILMISLAASLWSGTTGKIAGIILDKQNGLPLASANVMVQGTSLGAAADIHGNYTILQVPPGTYELQVTMMGYAKTLINDIQIRIDQTTRVDMELEIEAIEGEIVTVLAERNLVKDDVATSVVSISNTEVEELPVAQISNVVQMQAGVDGFMQIRGGQQDEALFQLNGVTMRDPRNNNPIAGIALSAVKEVSIERGGFNAEYGQVRSGIINVITQEGKKEGYHGSTTFRYSPPQAKYFGISPFNKNSNWLRPYFDDDVCWDGTTTGVWDIYTQRQYPAFIGWKAISDLLLGDEDTTNDLTPAGAQRAYMWETRKQGSNDQPDYDIDAGFGGPIPFMSEKLGDLRFFSSYRRHREMLLVPLSRDDYVDWDYSLQFISNIDRSKTLKISAVAGAQYLQAQNWAVWSDASSGPYIHSPESISGLFEDRPARLFSTGLFSLTDIDYQSYSVKLSHTLNNKAFYEVSLEHIQRKYHTRPPRDQDLETMYEIVPGYFRNEIPFGYSPSSTDLGIIGAVYGAHACRQRDHSKVNATTIKLDYTNQLNFNNLVKTGIEFIYNDLDLDYGYIQSLSDGYTYADHIQMRVKPIRAAMYIQDKLEVEGFIANLGIRMDYSNSRADWWDVDKFDDTFFTSKYREDYTFGRKTSKGQWQLSPRIGISHPITASSKLFFNYGHFKQLPAYDQQLQISRANNGRLVSMGNPNLTLAKTISYELGYDHELFNSFLLQLAAFYHDILDQEDDTNYIGITGINYVLATTSSYEDIRGFELTLRKTQGRWWTAFANYTYQVTTSGNFGSQEIYQDPSEQKRYDENTQNLYQDRPLPRPYARVNLSLYTPENLGPSFIGMKPLAGFMANVLFNWRAGQWRTWNPNNLRGMNNNLQEVDYYNVELRLSKIFRFNGWRVQLFADIYNLFNTKRMALNNWGTLNDQNSYYLSLHLPESKAYENIPGNDKAGDYRKEGVDFQPIEKKGYIDANKDTGMEGVIYYEASSTKYMENVLDEAAGVNVWQEVDKKRMNKILDDNAYIDMPNQDSFTFLNPRQIFYGLRISFDLN